MRRCTESALVGLLGAGAAAAFAAVADRAMRVGPGLVLGAAVVGGANGAISGWRRIYAWRRVTGPLAFALDSTWALLTTASGLMAHAVAATQSDAGHRPDVSERGDLHVYERGFVPRRGFAITLGNVVSGAGDTSIESKRRLVTDHESVHCWQARWFGPVYPVLYVGWTIGAGAAGAVWWALARRDLPAARAVETTGYYLNPFEWWAYSRHGYWPPAGAVRDLAWQRPCCRPFSDVGAAAN